MQRFVDTNILIYSISDQPQYAAKQARAQRILEDPGCCLSAQVLQEFYVQATRPTRPGRISEAAAADLVAQFGRFPIQPITFTLLQAAIAIQRRFHLSYWDSAIIAAAAALGCEELLTEDLQHDQTVAGVRIVNPFL